MFESINKHFEEYLGAFLLAVMAIISFINVVLRYCTNLSFAASEELTINFFVWVVLLGSAIAFRDGSNFCMNLLYTHSSRPIQRIFYIFSLVASIAFFALVAYFGSIEVLDEIELEASSESLAIPVWLYTIITPASSVLIIARIIQRAFFDFNNNTAFTR